jgi:hypothetical protein
LKRRLVGEDGTIIRKPHERRRGGVSQRVSIQKADGEGRDERIELEDQEKEKKQGEHTKSSVFFFPSDCAFSAHTRSPYIPML